MYLRYKVDDEEHISLIRDIRILEKWNQVEIKCDFGVTVIVYNCVGLASDSVEQIIELLPEYSYEVFK